MNVRKCEDREIFSPPLVELSCSLWLRMYFFFSLFVYICIVGQNLFSLFVRVFFIWYLYDSRGKRDIGCKWLTEKKCKNIEPIFLFMSKKMGQLHDVAYEHGIPMMALEEAIILCNVDLYWEGKIH